MYMLSFTNTTSVLQPCDTGIIKSFKAKYRAKLIKHTLVVFDQTKKVAVANEKQCIEFFREAWRG